eukprot:6183370-Pleurochrysis_carterae.AAC.4
MHTWCAGGVESVRAPPCDQRCRCRAECACAWGRRTKGANARALRLMAPATSARSVDDAQTDRELGEIIFHNSWLFKYFNSSCNSLEPQIRQWGFRSNFLVRTTVQ